MSETITIFLLDPIHGEAIQTSEFRDANIIQIARDASNHVVLTDAAVPRRQGWECGVAGKNRVYHPGSRDYGPDAAHPGNRHAHRRQWTVSGISCWSLAQHPCPAC